MKETKPASTPHDGVRRNQGFSCTSAKRVLDVKPLADEPVGIGSLVERSETSTDSVDGTMLTCLHSPPIAVLCASPKGLVDVPLGVVHKCACRAA